MARAPTRTPPSETSPETATEAPPATVPDPPSGAVVDEGAVWLPISEVRRWDKNPRINNAAVPKVADSIRRFGFAAPAIVWREAGRLIAGHTRMTALESILAVDPHFVPVYAPRGVTPGMMPVRFHPFASEAEATAYAIADNRLNEIAEWDKGLLGELLGALEAPLVELSGFTVDMPTFKAPFTPTLLGHGGTAAATEGEDGASQGSAPPDPPNRNNPPRDPNAVVIHYDLIFETVAQQDEWNEVLRRLRKTTPGDTHAARLLNALRKAPEQGV